MFLSVLFSQYMFFLHKYFNFWPLNCYLSLKATSSCYINFWSLKTNYRLEALMLQKLKLLFACLQCSLGAYVHQIKVVILKKNSLCVLQTHCKIFDRCCPAYSHNKFFCLIIFAENYLSHQSLSDMVEEFTTIFTNIQSILVNYISQCLILLKYLFAFFYFHFYKLGKLMQHLDLITQPLLLSNLWIRYNSTCRLFVYTCFCVDIKNI